MALNVLFLIFSFWICAWFLGRLLKPSKGFAGRWLKGNLAAICGVMLYLALASIKEYLIFDAVYGHLIDSGSVTYGEVMADIVGGIGSLAILGLLVEPIVLAFSGWNKLPSKPDT